MKRISKAYLAYLQCASVVQEMSCTCGFVEIRKVCANRLQYLEQYNILRLSPIYCTNDRLIITADLNSHILFNDQLVLECPHLHHNWLICWETRLYVACVATYPGDENLLFISSSFICNENEKEHGESRGQTCGTLL